MARQVIYVLSHGTKWKVECDHRTDEQIKDPQPDAIKAAKKHVAGLPAGTLSQIKVLSSELPVRETKAYLHAQPHESRKVSS